MAKKYSTSYYTNQINNYNKKVNKDLKTSIDQTNADYNNKLAEAYVTRMQNQKALDKSLANQGIKGGVSETAQLGLMTNYGNTRNALQGQKQTAITALQNNANDNKFNYTQTVNAQRQQYLQNRWAEDRANARADKLNAKVERLENYKAKYSGWYSIASLQKKYRRAKTSQERQAINARIGYLRMHKKGY